MTATIDPTRSDSGAERRTAHGVAFDFHGLLTLHVADDSPSLDILSAMFEPFVVDRIVDAPDIQVVVDHDMPVDASHAEHDYLYDERSVWLAEIDVQVRATDAGGWIVSGTRELLTTVVPLVDEVMARRRAAMIHATMVDLDGRGILMPAWGGVGKTSTMAKLVAAGCRFMGDDWGFLAHDGQLLGYAKPMFIKPHHRPIYPHLFEGARKPLVPKRLSRPVGRLTSRVHPVLTKYPRTAARVRRWSPEHKRVTPAQAFPGTTISTTAPLTLCVFAERHDGSAPELVPQTTEWMVDRLVGNFYSELPVHSHAVLTALTATGLVPMHRSQAAKAEVVRSGLGDVPCFLMRVPAAWSADRASDHISAALLDVARSTER